MEIEIRLAIGRVVKIKMPAGTVLSSTQLGVLMRWAIMGKSAEVMLD